MEFRGYLAGLWLTGPTARKEAKRLEKLAKAATKVVNPAQSGAPSARKEKKEKAQEAKATAAPVEKWVNTTPAGEKKGACSSSGRLCELT